MRRFGLPDETCQNYLAHDQQCTPETLCMNCMYVEADESPHCWGIPENQTIKYYVKEYGFVSGEAAIMNEIRTNGPVTCGATAPDSFAYGYHGGVYTDRTNSSDIDHDVEIAGWGEENGEKYWLIRNSWGSYWGENGWFRLIRGVNNMHIEEQCAAAVVDTHELDWMLDGKVTGSMFGVIPKSQPPQYFPKKWLKGWPHHWATTEKAALAAERANVKQLDDIAEVEGLKDRTHVPKSIRAATRGFQQAAAAALIPGSGEALPPFERPIQAGVPGAVMLAFGVVIGVALSGCGLVIYRKMAGARRSHQYVTIE